MVCDTVSRLLQDPTAVIGSGAVIGPNVVVGPHCIIESGARVKSSTLFASAKYVTLHTLLWIEAL
mgnify:CR=1 FL=1